MAAAFFAVAAAVTPAGPSSAEDLKIGALIPLSGDLQSIGVTAENGIRLAAEQINAAGGLLGRRLVIVSGDTRTDPQAGAAEARRLIAEEHVVGMVGALASGVTIRIFTDAVDAAKIPQISYGSTTPVLSDLVDDGYLFRTVPSDAFQGEALAQVAMENGYQSLGVLYIDNAYGRGLASALAHAFDRIGGTVEARSYKPNQASYLKVLRDLAGNGNALVLIGYPASGTTIIREAVQIQAFIGILLADGMKVPALIEAVGPAYQSVVDGTAPHPDVESPAARGYRDAYDRRFGPVPPIPYHDTAYDAVYLLALAIAKAGSADGAMIRDCLREVSRPPGVPVLPGQFAKALALIAQGKDIDYIGASGSVDIDRKGDVSGSFAHWRIENGKIVVRKVFQPVM